MKTYKHLFEKVIDIENIKTAIDKASLGKRTRKDVIRVRSNKEYYASRLHDMLENNTYVSPKHIPCEINDGIKQKKRTIIKPKYRYEQILHHAIIQVMQPIFMKGMYEYSCGSIPYRGAHYGKKYIEKHKYKYCLKIDVYHFFQSISHNELKEKFRRIIKDDRMVSLLDMVIDDYSDHSDDDDSYGLPIGFYTSQWFSNWYLQGLDHYIKQDLKAKCYVRYMDDMVILGNNKRELHKMRKSIESYLNDMKLTMKNKWSIFKTSDRAIDFMGFRFFENRTIVRKQLLYKASRKARSIKSKEHVTWFDACQIISYMGWFKACDMHNAYEKWIRPYVNIRYMRKKISKHNKEISKRMNQYGKIK